MSACHAACACCAALPIVVRRVLTVHVTKTDVATAQQQNRRRGDVDAEAWKSYVKDHHTCALEVAQMFYHSWLRFGETAAVFHRLSVLASSHDDRLTWILAAVEAWCRELNRCPTWLPHHLMEAFANAVEDFLRPFHGRVDVSSSVHAIRTLAEALRNRALGRASTPAEDKPLPRGTSKLRRHLQSTNIWSVAAASGTWSGGDQGDLSKQGDMPNEDLPPPTPRLRAGADLLDTVDRHDVLSFDPIEVARQLTLATHKMFVAVPLHQLSNKAWIEPRSTHLADDLLRLTDHAAALQSWTMATILQGSSPQARASRISSVRASCAHAGAVVRFTTVFAFTGTSSKSCRRARSCATSTVRQGTIVFSPVLD